MNSTVEGEVGEKSFGDHVLGARRTELDIVSTMTLVEVVRKIAVTSEIHNSLLMDDTEMTTFDTSPEM